MVQPNPRTIGSTGDPDMDARIGQLVEDWGCDYHPELIREMVVTALKLAKDQMPVADLKLFNRTLKELRRAANVFEPYSKIPKIAVFGSARTKPDEPEFQAAEAFSRKMKDHGFMIITGGGDGIMGAAQRGAGRKNSFGLNIRLPFEQAANETIEGDHKLVTFNYFFTRKLNFLKETHAIALFPGGFGTMDEGFEAITLMQTGKARIMPLVMVDKPGGMYWETWHRFLVEHLLRLRLISEEDFSFFKVFDDVDAAVEEVLRFYRIYHSSRWVGDQFVVRLKRPITADSVEALNEKFSGLLASGHIGQTSALPEEKNEENLLTLKRLVLRPHRINFGRMRRFIDAVNDAETA